MNFRNKVIIETREGVDYVDKNRELKNICTDFVVSEFFSSGECLQKFMRLIGEMYNIGIERYIKNNGLSKDDILFVYKGGNIVRIIGKEFMREVSGDASDILKNFYGKDLKRSDADFSIYINPTLNGFEDIVDDMTELAFQIQKEIRDEIFNDLSEFFNYFKYNNHVKSKILTRLVDKMRDSNYFGEDKSVILTFMDLMIPNIGASDYRGEYDKRVYFEGSNVAVEEYGNPEMIYISNNKALKFKLEGKTIHFNLVRSKICFNILYESDEKMFVKKVGGELIDVSIPREREALMDMFYNLNDNLAVYTILYDNSVLYFKSYSLRYFIKDLEEILLSPAQLPWSDSKYKKRLNRLMYLYFIEFMIHVSGLKDKVNFLKRLKSGVHEELVKLKSGGRYSFREFIDYAKERNLRIWHLLIRTSIMVEKLGGVSELLEFIESVETNVNVLVRSLVALARNNWNQSIVDERKIYDGEMNEALI